MYIVLWSLHGGSRGVLLCGWAVGGGGWRRVVPPTNRCPGGSIPSSSTKPPAINHQPSPTGPPENNGGVGRCFFLNTASSIIFSSFKGQYQEISDFWIVSHINLWTSNPYWKIFPLSMWWHFKNIWEVIDNPPKNYTYTVPQRVDAEAFSISCGTVDKGAG
jgi:hypothetical protein